MADDIIDAAQTADETMVPETAGPEEQAAEAADETASWQKQVEELTTRLQRLQADFDNFRRRSRAESEQLSLFVTARLVSGFLPALDNLERALSAGETQDAENLKKGMELIYRQLEKSLIDAGVEKIAALGEQFSPDWHEAVLNSQNSDLPDGQIDLVLAAGYKIRDKVIRHSQVRVISNAQN